MSEDYQERKKAYNLLHSDSDYYQIGKRKKKRKTLLDNEGDIDLWI
jgi:hypothetical protein